jgi:hypothetical protein
MIQAGADLLRIGGVPKPEGCKAHVVQTTWAQTCTAEGSPKYLAVQGQFALAGGGDGDEDDRAQQELTLLPAQGQSALLMPQVARLEKGDEKERRR